MTIVTMYQDKNQLYTGFEVSGHAGFAESGQDIICSAISILIINTINSIESFTEDFFSYEEDEDQGYMRFSLDETCSAATQLLLKSMVLGLSEIQKQHKSKYLKLKFEEV